MQAEMIRPQYNEAHSVFLAWSDTLDAALSAALVREREAYRRGRREGYADGYARGYFRAVAELKGVQVELVARLGDLGETLRRRWHLCCIPCRRAGCRPGCRDCQDRTRETFADLAPGEHGPALAALGRAS